jgi:4-oxalocrotonate tautomerase
MPQLNLRLVAEADTARSAQAIAELTALTAQLLGKRSDVTAVAIDHIAPAHWGIAGQPLAHSSQRAFFLEVLVTTGTNVSGDYRTFIAEAYALLDRLLGGVHPASYVAIREVRADAWGYGGVTQEGRRATASLASAKEGAARL